MEKRIRASKIEDVSPVQSSPSSHRSEQFRESPVQIPRPYAPVSARERSVVFVVGLITCIVGVILIPILIGIPILCVGLWALLFPASLVKHYRTKTVE